MIVSDDSSDDDENPRIAPTHLRPESKILFISYFTKLQKI